MKWYGVRPGFPHIDYEYPSGLLLSNKAIYILLQPVSVVCSIRDISKCKPPCLQSVDTSHVTINSYCQQLDSNFHPDEAKKPCKVLPSASMQSRPKPRHQQAAQGSCRSRCNRRQLQAGKHKDGRQCHTCNGRVSLHGKACLQQQPATSDRPCHNAGCRRQRSAARVNKVQLLMMAGQSSDCCLAAKAEL